MCDRIKLPFGDTCTSWACGGKYYEKKTYLSVTLSHLEWCTCK